MKRSSFLFMLFLCSIFHNYFIRANGHTDTKNGSITGMVIDGTQKLPVAFATVVLKST